MSSYNLGQEFEHEGHLVKVIRIVHHEALMEDKNKQMSVITEDYLELKLENGTIDFLVLTSERKPFAPTEGQAVIKAPEPIVWRKD